MTYKGYLIDLDGSFYIQEQNSGWRSFVHELQKRGIPYLFCDHTLHVATHVTRTPEMVQTIKKENFNNIETPLDTIYTANPLATITTCRRKIWARKFMLSEMSGLNNAIEEVGYRR